jgi:cell division septal protein FtsQ
MNMRSKRKILDYHHKLRKPIASRAFRAYHLAGRRKWRKRILVALAIFILAGLLYFLFYSDYFMIQEIKMTVQGEVIPSTSLSFSTGSARDLVLSKKNDIRGITEQALNQKRFYIFFQRNIFLFERNQLREKISKKYNLEELKISKKLPHKLEIKIKEKLPSLILDLRSFTSLRTSLWFLDTQGQILEKTTEEEMKKNILPLVSTRYSLTTQAEPEIFVNQKIFSKEKINFIEKIFSGLSELALFSENAELWFIVPAQKEPKLIVKTPEGWEIYLDSSGNPEEQLDNLSLILKEKIRENRKNLRYIDLRFGERVYYH